MDMANATAVAVQIFNIVKENTALKEENKELKMFLKATENELACYVANHEKEQWDSYFKKGKDSFVNDDDTVRGES